MNLFDGSIAVTLAPNLAKASDNNPPPQPTSNILTPTIMILAMIL